MTHASAIANPYPPSGNAVLEKLEEHDGRAVSVGDEEIKRAQKKIAREGIYAQPASCVGAAGIGSLVNDGTIEEGSKVVTIITGSGLKTMKDEGASGIEEIEMEELEEHLGRDMETF